MEYRTYPGQPHPLGATWDGSGVNFALFSEHAEAVELCLFDQPYGAAEFVRIRLKEQTDYVWHVYLPEARPGLLYGYRVYGPGGPSAAAASTRTSCSSIPMRRRSPAPSSGQTPCSATR
jgi:glycogen operon protein